MTFPTVAVDTTDTDADTDSPLAARQDILDAIQKLNQMIAHVSAFAATILDDADAAAVRATIGAIATDAELTAIAGLASDADLGIYFTGPGAASLFTLTAQARSLLDDADAAAMRATIGVAIGTNVQAQDAELAAIAGLTSAADRGVYFTGSGTASLFTFTAQARSLLDDATAGDMQTTLGISAFVKTILDDADAATVRTTIGAMATDATLTALAAYNTNGILTQTAADTFAGRTLTAPAAGFTITNPAGVAGNPTFVLANDLAALEVLGSTGIAARTGTDTWAQRTITGSTSITVTDGSGVSGNPTLALSATHLPGKTSFQFPAESLRPRATNGCAAIAYSTGAANQPDVGYLAFDGAAKEYATFAFRMPKSWNEGTVTASFTWRRASGTGAANVVWGIRALAVGDNESPVANFGSDATVTDDAKTTLANFSLSGETGACTVAGTAAAEDQLFLEVFRDGASGSDTLDSVDAWLTNVTLHITVDAFNDT